MSIPPTLPFFFYDRILAIIMSIPPAFPVLSAFTRTIINVFPFNEKRGLSEGRVHPQKLIEIMQFSNSISTGTRRYSDTP